MEQLTFLRADSLANLSVSLGSKEARKMTASSGEKCYELYKKSDQIGSSLKMLVGCLLSTTDWYSSRCYLTWKAKTTKSKRLLFQLVPSTPHTDETEFGLLPTITSETGRKSNFKQGGKSMFTALKEKGLLPTVQTQGLKTCQEGKSIPMNLTLLPTPRVSDTEGGVVKNVQVKNGRAVRVNKKGETWGVKLKDVVENGLLPTPKAQDSRCAKTDRGKRNFGEVIHGIAGKTSQLNPHFVAEMMGFPPNWLDFPFQNGEQSPSKPTETQ